MSPLLLDGGLILASLLARELYQTESLRAPMVVTQLSAGLASIYRTTCAQIHLQALLHHSVTQHQATVLRVSHVPMACGPSLALLSADFVRQAWFAPTRLSFRKQLATLDIITLVAVQLARNVLTVTNATTEKH